MSTPTAPLIGSVEAGRLLGRSPRTIHRLVTAGVLRPAVVAPGGGAGVYLFDRAEVERLAAEREQASA